MKRPLGIIGLVYLTVLAVVFHFYSIALVIAVSVSSALTIIVSLTVKCIKKNITIHRAFIAAGLSAMAAVLSLFLYQNYIINPIINDYSDKEITITGYLCDEFHFNKNSTTCTIQTETIDGKDVSVKIQLSMTDGLDIEPLDKIRATLTVHASNYDYQLSRKIFFYAFQDEKTNVERTGEKQYDLYSWAVRIRMKLKSTLHELLPDDCSQLSKAILLGDKHSLSSDVKGTFEHTGMSYLIVVSGFHLAVVAGVLKLLLRQMHIPKVARVMTIIIFILGFMALTGFTPSVIRSGVMVLIAYGGRLFFRTADSINSLGIAALILTVPNPYAVGDIGMLLSFAATFGILLWANRLTSYFTHRLKLTDAPKEAKRSLLQKAVSLFQSLLKFIINAFSVSLSAMLWIMPITVFAFDKINPLTVFFSAIASPLASAVLLCSMITVVLYFIPFVNIIVTPLSLVTTLFGSAFLKLIHLFDTIPFSQIYADKLFYKIWVIISVLLVIIGYAIHAKGLYIRMAAVISALSLTIGGSVSYLCADRSSSLTIYPSGYGYTVAITKGENVTLIGCGGKYGNQDKILSEIKSRTNTVDNIIVPVFNQSHAAYLPEICHQFDVSNILVYDSPYNSELAAAFEKEIFFGGDTSFTISANADTQVTVVTAKNKVYFYITSPEISVLFLPKNAKLDSLPEEMRTADYVVCEGDFDSAELSYGKQFIRISTDLTDGEEYQIHL